MKKKLFLFCNLFLIIQISSSAVLSDLYINDKRIADFRSEFLKNYQGSSKSISIVLANLSVFNSTDTAFLPLTGGTLFGTLTGTSANFSGSVGIGTSTPVRKLDVNGDANVATNLVVGTSVYTNGYTAYSSSPVYFKNSGGVDVMTHLSGGNVGIGTTSPNSKLDVNGNITMSADATTRTIWNSGYGGAIQLLRSDATSTRWAKLGIVDASGTWVGGIHITNGTDVGIGTTNPSSKLDVNGDIAMSANATTRTIWNSGYGGAIQLLRSDATSTRWARLGIVDGSGVWVTGIHVSSSGNVGIGTTTPAEKLSVDGNIAANGYITSKKLTVTQTGWSDYVFEKDYKLRSLQSLESYINQNKHLPEIPTATEVESNGISIGDNQALLLKKIEELTLYVIKQQKQIDNQSKEIKILKNKK